MAADPLTPHETGLNKQGLKDNAVVCGNKLVAAMIALRDAVEQYNRTSIMFAGAQAAYKDAGASDEDIVEIAKGCLKRSGVSDAEIAQAEDEMGLHGPTNLDKARVL